MLGGAQTQKGWEPLVLANAVTQMVLTGHDLSGALAGAFTGGRMFKDKDNLAVS